MPRKQVIDLVGISFLIPFGAPYVPLFDKLALSSLHDKNNDMHYFFLKLNPPRRTFAQDMSLDEKNTMQQHVIYWHAQMDQGKVVAYGPVMDPNGVYGRNYQGD